MSEQQDRRWIRVNPTVLDKPHSWGMKRTTVDRLIAYAVENEVDRAHAAAGYRPCRHQLEFLPSGSVLLRTMTDDRRYTRCVFLP